MQTSQPVLEADRLGDVQNLKPDTSGVITITPDTVVLCINRGREVYRDMFDSRQYSIAPGYFTAPHAAALHFKNRAVVPGSRNPESGAQASFIAILGVAQPTREGMKIVHTIDAPEEWEPFTDEECGEYGHAFEAIDRSSMEPGDRDVQLMPTFGRANQAAKDKAAASRVKSSGQATADGRRPATRIEGGGAALLKKGQKGDDRAGIPATLGATGVNDAIAQIRADTAAASQATD